ncbi:MAG TPA: 4'-phosphopantetheinyl transferase superfamily protein [Terrimicrobiaceae bacterium]
MIPWKQSSPGNDLQEGEVHLWRVGLDVSDPALCALRRMLSEDEVQRSKRYRFPVLQRRFAAGRGALRAILAGYLSMESDRLKFGYTAHGKPFLLDSAAIQFNLSHSGGLMVAAFCRNWPIGVDIEREDRRLDPVEIAERYFCDREKEEIARADTSLRHRVFFQLWTAKEAVLKATSIGLALELSKLEVALAPLRVVTLENEAKAHGASWHLAGFRPDEDYSGTLAVAGRPSRLEYYDFLPPSNHQASS